MQSQHYCDRCCILARESNIQMHKYLFFFLVVSISGPVCAQVAAQKDTSSRGEVRVNADFRFPEVLHYYQESNKGKQIAGYRIQLYSGERQTAMNLKASFIKAMPHVPCNLIYESPDFKLLAGNYRTQLEAECALQEIRQHYKSAFVVPALIDLPELTVK